MGLTKEWDWKVEVVYGGEQGGNRGVRLESGGCLWRWAVGLLQTREWDWKVGAVYEGGREVYNKGVELESGGDGALPSGP